MYAALAQALDHLIEALGPVPADRRQGGIESHVVGRDEVAEQVHLPAAVLGGDLGAGDDLDAPAGRGGAGGGHPAERVVVGDGHGRQAAAAGQVHHLGRRVAAVAVRGVQVQVGAAGVPRAAGRLAERGERLLGGHQALGSAVGLALRRSLSRTPLTKAGESAEP